MKFKLLNVEAYTNQLYVKVWMHNSRTKLFQTGTPLSFFRMFLWKKSKVI